MRVSAVATALLLGAAGVCARAVKDSTTADEGSASALTTADATKTGATAAADGSASGSGESYDEGSSDSVHPTAPPSQGWVAPAGHEGFHYPYRPKFTASAVLGGECVLADFHIKRKLGKGGFGQVYLAKHKPSGQTVAMKRISGASIAEKPRHIELEETIGYTVRTPFAGKLHCTLHDPATHDIYLVLEYFGGGNLSHHIETLRPFPRETLARYIGQIILALRSMHADCVVYRDLKAENVMVDAAGNARLIDFGLAIRDCGNRLTALAGTLEYVAPEVAGRRPYGRAADYYCAGVLLYILVTGKHPYRRPRAPRDARGVRDKDAEKRAKDAFVADVARGRFPIPKTGDADADAVIARLTTHDAGERWRLVHERFAELKAMPFFRSFSWEYYEAYPHYVRDFRAAAPAA